MKLFNITDVSTPQLEQRGLVNMTLALRGALVAPGEMVEVPGDELTVRDAQSYVSIGAMAINDLPPGYILAKEKQKQAEKVAATPPEEYVDERKHSRKGNR